jgi:dienelactone hydrolase
MKAARDDAEGRLYLFRFASALLVCCSSLLLIAAQLSSQVPSQDVRNIDIITVNTHLQLPQFTSLKAWQERKAFLRNQILVSAGLSPMPEKTPLHPQIFGKIEGERYTIEKVLLETFPGFYLGGNLYRPRDSQRRHPGILNPQGHWPYGRLQNDTVYSGPSLGISLARQGYVVFSYDMVGYNDTIQVPHRFGSAEQRLWSFGPLGQQLWDSIRALDFLTTLQDVDASQLGAVGASGGGTQSFLLAAVDDRVQFASPVNMVSAIMQGGDLCENAPGLRINTSNVEIAAMFAPKPMLLVSATGDWTRNVPNEEFPAIKRIYDLYGKGDQVKVVQIEAEHNFNRHSREAVYRFLANLHPGLSDSGELTESHISIPMLQELTVLSNRTLPAGALNLQDLFEQWKRFAQVQNQHPQDPTVLRERLRQTLAVENPRDVVADMHGRSIVLSRASKGDRVPGLWLEGNGKPAIVLDPSGVSAAVVSAVVKQLQKDGRPILIPDLFQTGEAKAPRPGDVAVEPATKLPEGAGEEEEADAAAGYAKFLTFNVSVDAARVQDILTAIAWEKRSNRGVEVFARGDAGIWAAFAAAVSDSPVSLHGKDVPTLSSDADYIQHFNVPGILRAGGLSAAHRLMTSQIGR